MGKRTAIRTTKSHVRVNIVIRPGAASPAQIKKVIKIGGSLAIILPAQWAKGKVSPGQEMVVVGNGELHIFPVHLQVCLQDIKDVDKDA